MGRTKENILLSKDSQPLHNQLSSYVNCAVLVHNDKNVLPDHCILSYFSEYDCIYLTLLNLSVFIRIKMFSGYSLLFVIYLFTLVLVGVIDIDIFSNIIIIHYYYYYFAFKVLFILSCEKALEWYYIGSHIL